MRSALRVLFLTTLAMLAQKGTEHINNSRQFQSTMTFQLTAVKKKALKVDKPTILNVGYINSSDDSEEETNMKNDEEEY